MFKSLIAAVPLIALMATALPATAADTKAADSKAANSKAKAPKQETTPVTAPLDQRTLKLFTELEALWRSRDFKQMRRHWVKDLAAPVYLPEEKKEFITTWAQFDAYFANAANNSKNSLVTYKPLFAMPSGPGQQMVAFELEWTMQLVNEAAPIGGSVRGFALMEDDGQAWKLKAYIEAPLAPIIYMRDLYQLVAKERGFKPVP